MSFSLQYVFAATSAMVLNALIIPFLIRLAHRHRWYDNVNGRKIHVGDIPRIGGIGITVSFFLVIVLFFLIKDLLIGNNSEFTEFMTSSGVFLSGAVAVSIIGLLDDFKNLRPLYKLFSQIFISLIVIFTGHYFKSFYIPFADVTVTSPLLGQIVTFLWIVGITNAVNLIDGMDGLSSGITGITAFFMGMTAVAAGNTDQAAVVFILFGSLSGFLIYNFPPAKLFMGDSGSLFIGFVLAVLPLYTFGNTISPYSLILSISFMFIPIADTFAAIIRRKIKGVPFHTPDKEHLHHKLLALGLSTKQVLLIVYSVTFILSAVSYIFSLTGNTGYISLLIILWVISLILFFILARKVKKLPDIKPDIKKE